MCLECDSIVLSIFYSGPSQSNLPTMASFLKFYIGVVLGAGIALMLRIVLYALKSQCLDPSPDNSHLAALFDVVNSFATRVSPEHSSRRIELISAIIAESYGVKQPSNTNTTQTETENKTDVAET